MSNQRSMSLMVVVMIVMSVPVAIYAFGFQLRMAGDPEFWARFDTQPLLSGMHVLGAGLALLIGGFQFSGRIRQKFINLHRWLGRTYLSAALVGGIGGFAIALNADGGLVAKFGFAMLAVVWLYSSGQAYTAIRAKDIATHREWMMRSFALAFAAVTLRIYLGVLQALGFSFSEAYPVTAWLSWVPNLLLVEWWLLKPSRAKVSTAAKVAVHQP
jgi:uncharacterized membrane protein